MPTDLPIAPTPEPEPSHPSVPAPAAALEAAESSAAPAPTESSAGSSAVAPDAGAVTRDQVRLALRRVKDPELNLNIVDLGLVYEVDVAGPLVRVDMSLTSPACPSGPDIMRDAEDQLRKLEGVGEV